MLLSNSLNGITPTNNMEKLIFIWLCIGLYAYWIDQIRPKMDNETAIPFVRCVFGGLASLVLVVVAMSATPANEYENEIY